MNVTLKEHSRLAALMPVLSRHSEAEIERAYRGDTSSPLWPHLHLWTDNSFTAIFTPIDWRNVGADIILVGATPGFTQACEAALILRRRAIAGVSVERAIEAAKQAASFKGLKGTMADLMDAAHLNRLFEMPTCRELFGSAGSRVHATSALRYPVLKNGKNFSGDKRVMRRPHMRAMVEEYLVPELAAMPSAWIVPFDACAQSVLDDVVARGLINGDRLLGGLLHPSGQQRNRHRVQLGEVTGAAALAVPGGRDIVERTEALREKVASVVERRRRST